uniref:ORF7 n=1 Tax=Parastrongyloides trichosuri TaxID=131310 RepID=A0A0N4ZCK0_PARTI
MKCISRSLDDTTEACNTYCIPDNNYTEWIVFTIVFAVLWIITIIVFGLCLYCFRGGEKNLEPSRSSTPSLTDVPDVPEVTDEVEETSLSEASDTNAADKE